MMAAVEPDDRLARFGVIILFQIQPIPLIMQRGILAQQAHIGAARHRPMGAAIVQQIGHAMQDLRRLVGPDRSVPLAFGRAAQIPILPHIIFVAGLDRAHSRLAGERRGVDQMRPRLRIFGIVGHQAEHPGQIADQLPIADRVPIVDELVVARLVPVDEVRELVAPQGVQHPALQRVGARSIVGRHRLVARHRGHLRQRAGIGEHIAVDRRAESVPAPEAVLAARRVDRRHGIFGRIEQRLDEIEAFVEIEMIVPQAVDMVHHRQMFDRILPVAIDQVTAPDAVGHMIGEMPVIAAAAVHEIDIIVGKAPVAQPASFADMEAAGVVQAGIGLALPVDIVEKFGGDIALGAQVALMPAENLPAIIIDRVDPGIGGFEEGDAVFIPGRIIAEARRGDGGRVHRGRGRGGADPGQRGSRQHHHPDRAHRLSSLMSQTDMAAVPGSGEISRNDRHEDGAQ